MAQASDEDDASNNWSSGMAYSAYSIRVPRQRRRWTSQMGGSVFAHDGSNDDHDVVHGRTGYERIGYYVYIYIYTYDFV